MVKALASVANPKPHSLVFVQRRLKEAEAGGLENVGAILCAEELVRKLPDGPAKIVVKAPQAAFALVARVLYPASLAPAQASAEEGYNPDYPHAHVSIRALIEEDVTIGAGAVIGDFAAIGRGSAIGAATVVANHCQIGRNCRIGPGVALQYCLIGNGVIIHGGVQVGQDGFGFVPGPSGLEKVPQLGRVIIQDQVELGANTTVDRGAIDDTVIGEGTKIDNQVQIAHNVRIGRHCVIAAQSGLSGSVTVGDFCMFGGGVGIADHVTIGSGVQIAGTSAVMNDIPDGERWAGAPALPAKEFFRQMAALRKAAGTGKTPKAN